MPVKFRTTDSSAWFKKRLTTIVIVTNLLVYCLVGVSLYQSRTKYEKQAAITTQNLARVLDYQVKGEIDNIDMALIAVKHEAEARIARGGIDKEALDRYITLIHSHLLGLQGLRMTNSRGDVIYGTGALTPGVVFNMSDRDYFVFERDHPNTDLFISKPVLGRIAKNKWTLNVAHRVDNPDGSFAGVVYGAFTLDHFTQIFSRIDLGQKGSVTLRDGELAIVARYPEPKGIGSAVGNKIVAKEYSDLIKAGNANATFKAKAHIDGTERLFSYRKISNSPWFVIVALAKDEYLADWQKEALVQLSLAALFTLVTIISSRILFTRWSRESEIESQLRKAKDELELRIEERTADLNQANEQLILELSERIQAEEALTESEYRWKFAIEGSGDGVWDWNIHTDEAKYSKRWKEMLGYAEDDISPTNQEWVDRIHPEDQSYVAEAMQAYLDGKMAIYVVEYRLRCKDGSYKWILGRGMVVSRSGDGEPLRMIGTHTDITGRKQIEEKLRLSEEKFSTAFRVSPDAININRLNDGMFLEISEGLTAITGYTSEEVIGKTSLELNFWDNPEDRAHLTSEIKERGVVNNFEAQFKRKDGSNLTGIISARNIEVEGVPCLLSITRDISERKRAEEALRLSEERHRVILNSAMDGFWLVDTKGNMLEVNETYCRMSGYSVLELLAMRICDLEAAETADDTGAHIRKVMAQGEDRFESLHRRKDGSIFCVEVSVQYRSVEGGRLVVFLRDITERKRAEEENAKLGTQLLQAQKMESVGHLAGGVAHDFNNMLGVIIGHAELAIDRLDPALPLYTNLTEIRKAAERSADLTRQLLAFARKQTIVPKVLDLNEDVANMLNMLQRLIGENIHLHWQPETDLWQVKVDPSQIDQILANLCVNARDSIADVGDITIKTGNSFIDESYCSNQAGFVPGEYVLISISDNGCGMDKDTLTHIFEPFFTTKGVGEGSGLGLSTVYGATKQNNGFIYVYSEPGLGSTFTIYLPRHTGKGMLTRTEVTAKPVAHGQETILLVEDEPSILNVTTMILTGQGYTVLAANSPGEAIRLAGEHAGEISLLITDVIMPEMNGRDLAENLRSLYPHIKRLFMSGYTADVIAQHGALDEGVHFIQKPFSTPGLAAKVREVCDAP